MKKLIATLILSIGLLLAAGVASASIIEANVAGGLTNQIGPSTGYTQTVTVGGIVATLIQVALGFLAVIFLILMIVAGFGWMTAAGDEAKVKKARGTIVTAIIGLVIVLAAYSLTYFLFHILPFSVGAGPQGSGSGTY